MPFKDLKEGQTHYENDGCGEPEHNDKMVNKKLYKITSVDQTTGNDITTYVLALNALDIEREFSDIISIEPLTPFEDLTKSE